MKKLFFFIFVFFITSCSNNDKNSITGILKKEEFLKKENKNEKFRRNYPYQAKLLDEFLEREKIMIINTNKY